MALLGGGVGWGWGDPVSEGITKQKWDTGKNALKREFKHASFKVKFL